MNSRERYHYCRVYAAVLLQTAVCVARAAFGEGACLPEEHSHPPGRNWKTFPEVAVVAKRFQSYELLIADDDPGFREALREIFEPYFHLIEACCGEEAVEIVQRREIDLALLDMHMRALSGLETLRIVKSLRALLPCIIITADPTDELRRDAAEAEAFTVLKKPVPRSELVATVSTALQAAYHDPDFHELTGLG